MLRGMVTKVQIWLQRVRSMRSAAAPAPIAAPPAARRLERVSVTDGVMRTLFDDYAEHRRTPRGDEEIGWILLGLWHEGEATALAALPAGAERDASAVHVRFNTDAQALASRILRQTDKRLRVIGVVHTHPGSMRYPSSGDLLGDSRWVAQLRTGEAIFGIGTAEVNGDGAGDANIYGDMCFSWYALGAGDQRYRPLPAHLTDGADLAVPLRPLWNLIEAHAAPLNRLCRQFARVQLDILEEGPSKLLAVKIALPEPDQQIRLLLNDSEARYYWDRRDELIAIDPNEQILERAIYLILAELAKESAGKASESPMLVES